jgi:serine/threonine protein kinase
MNTPTCQTCGKPLPAEAPGGICPSCLLQNTFQDASAPSLAAPELELQQLSAAFPQLVIEEMIGQGGMGKVYRAQQPHLNRTVALKVLSAERAGDPEWLERFSREARALARLSHPHIVQVYDFGEKPLPYLLMEHVEGVNLRQAMQQGGLTAREALTIVPKLCDALHYAHEHGVLHRDIKPENILIDTEGRVKLVDFGLAKLRDEGVLPFSLTQSGTKLGTLAYMAPEQVEKPGDVDHRADIYSLGVVLYEMLTGELPLGRFPTPSEASGVDARLDAVVLRTLEKHREKRFQSADEFKTGLGAAEKGPMPNKQHASVPVRWVVGGLAALLSLGLGFAWSFHRKSDKAKAAEVSVLTPAEKLKAASQKKYADAKPIRDQCSAWISSATKADSKAGQEKVLLQIREALQSKDEPNVRAACWALTGLGQIDFDHAPFRPLLRGLLESKAPDVRQAAIDALTACGLEDSDRARLDKLATVCTEEEVRSLMFAYKELFKGDFTGANGEPALKLMERGMEAAQRDGGSMYGIDSRGVLGAIWGSKVSPEIEARLVEWSHLHEDANGDIYVGNSSLGYNTFYHALSVVQNKSRGAVKRLVQLAYHPDTTNVAGRCFWGMNGTVPDPADQAYLAGEVIKLLGLRSDSYLWKGGLNILRGYANKDHIPALQELARRETLPADKKEALEQIILRLQRPS